MSITASKAHPRSTAAQAGFLPLSPRHSSNLEPAANLVDVRQDARLRRRAVSEAAISQLRQHVAKHGSVPQDYWDLRAPQRYEPDALIDRFDPQRQKSVAERFAAKKVGYVDRIPKDVLDSVPSDRAPDHEIQNWIRSVIHWPTPLLEDLLYCLVDQEYDAGKNWWNHGLFSSFRFRVAGALLREIVQNRHDYQPSFLLRACSQVWRQAHWVDRTMLLDLGSLFFANGEAIVKDEAGKIVITIGPEGAKFYLEDLFKSEFGQYDTEQLDKVLSEVLRRHPQYNEGDFANQYGQLACSVILSSIADSFRSIVSNLSDPRVADEVFDMLFGRA